MGTADLGGVCKMSAKMMNSAPMTSSTNRKKRMMHGRQSLRGMNFAMLAAYACGATLQAADQTSWHTSMLTPALSKL